MIAPAKYANPSRPEIPSFPVSGRVSVLAVGRSWTCPNCGGRRLISVSEHGGEVGELKGGDGSCLGECVWAANRDRIEFGRRARRRS